MHWHLLPAKGALNNADHTQRLVRRASLLTDFRAWHTDAPSATPGLGIRNALIASRICCAHVINQKKAGTPWLMLTVLRTYSQRMSCLCCGHVQKVNQVGWIHDGQVLTVSLTNGQILSFLCCGHVQKVNQVGWTHDGQVLTVSLTNGQILSFLATLPVVYDFHASKVRAPHHEGLAHAARDEKLLQVQGGVCVCT